MFLAIIIPMYNREDTISRCLDSILSQNFEEIEIICVDDGLQIEPERLCSNINRRTLISGCY